MTSTADRDRNIAAAGALVARAVAAGARLVVLPEKWPYIHGTRTREGAEGLDGPSVSAARSWGRCPGCSSPCRSSLPKRKDDANVSLVTSSSQPRAGGR